jgi:hypothetical protein
VNTVLQHCYAVEKNSRLCNLGSVEKRKRLAEKKCPSPAKPPIKGVLICAHSYS